MTDQKIFRPDDNAIYQATQLAEDVVCLARMLEIASPEAGSSLMDEWLLSRLAKQIGSMAASIQGHLEGWHA